MDDESGFVYYAEDMRKIWDGTMRHERNFETRQPQEFVHALNDPRVLVDIRPEPNAAAVVNSVRGEVGETDFDTLPSPAGHLFLAGVGEMIIEGTNPNTRFEVR